MTSLGAVKLQGELNEHRQLVHNLTAKERELRDAISHLEREITDLRERLALKDRELAEMMSRVHGLEAQLGRRDR